MSTPLQKDENIIRLLDKLSERLGAAAFDVVDHWVADSCAVGIARPDNHGVLVYVSTYGEPDDSYFVSLELPPRPGRWAAHPYTPAGENRIRGLDELVDVIEQHFGYGTAI